MRISTAADIAKVTVRTIRYYHQIGLLPTPPRRGSWRDYSIEDVCQLIRIRTLVHAGFSLEQVRQELEGTGRGGVEETLAAIDKQIAVLHRQRRALLELQDRQSLAEETPMEQVTVIYDAIEKEVVALDDVRALSLMRRERRISLALVRSGVFHMDFSQLQQRINPAIIARYYQTLSAMHDKDWSMEEADWLCEQGMAIVDSYLPISKKQQRLILDILGNSMVIKLCRAAFPQPGYQYLFDKLIPEMTRRLSID